MDLLYKFKVSTMNIDSRMKEVAIVAETGDVAKLKYLLHRVTARKA